MPSVAEILRQSGLNDEQIKAIDAKALAAFDTLTTTANQQLEQAELAQRAQTQLYENQIAPALDKWGNEKSNLEAERDYYRRLAASGKEAGFIPQEAPSFTPGQPRADDGKFVAGANPVPGSPQLVEQIRSEMRAELGGAFSDSVWAMQSYQKMTGGGYLPDDVVALSREAQTQRMPFRDYVAKKYDFAGKEAAIKAAEQKKHDDAIRAEVSADKEREFAEKYGNNGNMRAAEPSRFAEIGRAVKEGQRPDPLSMNQEQRRATTRSAIQHDIAENATTVQ